MRRWLRSRSVPPRGSSAVDDGGAGAEWVRWWTPWAYASLPGTCLGVLEPGLATVVAVAITAAVVTGVVMALGVDGDGVPPVRLSASDVGRTMACAGVVAVSVVALGSLVSLLAWGQGLAMMLTAPPVLRGCRWVLRAQVGAVDPTAVSRSSSPGAPCSAPTSGSPSVLR